MLLILIYNKNTELRKPAGVFVICNVAIALRKFLKQLKSHFKYQLEGKEGLKGDLS